MTELSSLSIALARAKVDIKELQSALQSTDATITQVEEILATFLPSHTLQAIPLQSIFSRYQTSDFQIDISAFCTGLQTCKSPHRSSRSIRSPTKKTLVSPSRKKLRSPRKRHQRRNSIDRLQRDQEHIYSIRRKLQSGGRNQATLDDLVDRLEQHSSNRDGYIDEQLFISEFLFQLQDSLTKEEIECVLTHLRTRGRKDGETLLNIDKLNMFCTFESDVSDFEMPVEQHSPSLHRQGSQSNLGSAFLVAEKELRAFLQQSYTPSEDGGSEIKETPRSIYTGAEHFLGLAKQIRPDGLLSAKDMHRVLVQCKLNVPPSILQSILSRFPETKDQLIDCDLFLQQYGQQPERHHARRQLRELIWSILGSLNISARTWATALQRRCTRQHVRLYSHKTGFLPARAFLRVLKKDDAMSEEKANEIISLFLKATSDDLGSAQVNYNEFIQLVESCDKVNKSVCANNTSSSNSSMTKEQYTPGEYLMHHATQSERQRFEELTELLYNFQRQIQVSGIQASDNTVSDGGIRSTKNGIAMALGPRLGVQIQFYIQ